MPPSPHGLPSLLPAHVLTRYQLPKVALVMSVIASMIVKIGADIAGLQQSMGQVESAVNKSSTSFGRLVGAHITAEAAMRITGAAARALGGFLEESVAVSARFNNSMIGLSSVAGAFGISADQAKGAAKRLASDGLMPIGDAAAGLKNLLAAGFSLPEATRMMDAFKDSAA